MALECDVVDRDRRSWTRPVVKMKVGRRKGGLPVMRMNNLRLESLDRATSDVGAYARERGKAQGVVWPINPVRAKIWVAGTVVEMRRVEREQVETRSVSRKHARRAAEQVRVFARDGGVAKLPDDRRIAGNKRSHLDAFARQSLGQRAHDVSEPTSLHQ